MEHSVSDLATPTNLRDLRAFCLIVIHGSITEAAKDLGETRGSVSRRMSRLERDLGVTLLRRTTRSVQPTEEGIRYHRHTEQALELLRDAAAGIQTAVPRGRLRVATSHGFALWAIAPLIGEFSRLYPQIRLDFVLTDEPPNFTGRELDAAIYPAHRLPDSSLIANRLLDWEPKLVASPAYIEAFGAPSSACDLQKFSVILGMGFAPRLKSGIIQSSARATALRGQTLLPNAIVSTSTAFAREAALAGAGIALVPDFLVRNDLEEERLRRKVVRDKSYYYQLVSLVKPLRRALRLRNSTSFRIKSKAVCEPKSANGIANGGPLADKQSRGARCPEGERCHRGGASRETAMIDTELLGWLAVTPERGAEIAAAGRAVGTRHGRAPTTNALAEIASQSAL